MGHDHTFVRKGQEIRTCSVTVEGAGDAQQTWVTGGFKDMVTLKSTGSELADFHVDPYTTLTPTHDRVMATSLVAKWRFTSTDVDWDATYEGVKAVLTRTFATLHTRSRSSRRSSRWARRSSRRTTRSPRCASPRLHIAGDARLADAASSLVSLRDGALVIDEVGRIAWTDRYADLPAEHARLPVTRADFLLPGFVDAHLHHPQVHATSAYGGGRLLHWLDHCVFPTEARLADETGAVQAAAELVARRLAAGTTTAMVFGSGWSAAGACRPSAHRPRNGC